MNKILLRGHRVLAGENFFFELFSFVKKGEGGHGDDDAIFLEK